MVSCPPCTRDHPYIGVDPYFRGEGGGSASATLPPPNRAQIPTGGGWAAEARRRHFQIPLRSKLVAERSRLEIFMYSCNAREYLLLYEGFMLIIDYLFSERIFFNAGDRLIDHMAFLQNESFYVPSSAVFAWKICRTCDRQRAFLQYDSFREYLGHHASWKKFTLFARIWPFTCMDSFVDIKIAFALERLGALITMQKWIIMNKLVALELRTYLERFTTYFARECLLMNVDILVYF